jgi:hypothetical protein
LLTAFALRATEATSAFVAGDISEEWRYYHVALPSRRRSTIRQPRWKSDDLPIAPKTVELEQRISRLEGCCADMQEQLTIVVRRLTALQAQLDYFIARMSL